LKTKSCENKLIYDAKQAPVPEISKPIVLFFLILDTTWSLQYIL